MDFSPYEYETADRLAKAVARNVNPPATLVTAEDVYADAHLQILRYWDREVWEASPAFKRGVDFDKWLKVRVYSGVRDSYSTEFARMYHARRVYSENTFRPAGDNSRQKERRRGVSNGDKQLGFDTLDYSAIGVPRLPDNTPEKAEEAEMTRAAVDRLAGRQRAVIVGLYFENKTQKQLAAELGVTQPAIQRLKQRALERLYTQLTPETR